MASLADLQAERVSIHAPARGATISYAVLCDEFTGVSIHAPARGATGRAAFAVAAGEFQSTRPHEARRCDAGLSTQPSAFQSTRPHEARHGF